MHTQQKTAFLTNLAMRSIIRCLVKNQITVMYLVFHRCSGCASSTPYIFPVGWGGVWGVGCGVVSYTNTGEPRERLSIELDRKKRGER